jgi:hypothetical protein
MTLEFELTKADINKLAIEYQETIKPLAEYRESIRYGVSIITPVLLVLSILTDPKTHNPIAIGVVLVLGFAIFMILFFSLPELDRALRRDLVKKLVDSGSYKTLIGFRKFQITPQSIQGSDGTEELSIEWKHVEKVVVTKNFLILNLINGLFLPIPKSVFANEPDFHQAVKQFESFQSLAAKAVLP